MEKNRKKQKKNRKKIEKKWKKMRGNKIYFITQFSFNTVNHITSKYIRYDLYSLQMSIGEMKFVVYLYHKLFYERDQHDQ